MSFPVLRAKLAAWLYRVFDKVRARVSFQYQDLLSLPVGERSRTTVPA